MKYNNIITKYNMNSNGTSVGGWRDSEIRQYINNKQINIHYKDK